MKTKETTEVKRMTKEERVEYDVNIGMTILKLEKNGNFTHEEAMKMMETLLF